VIKPKRGTLAIAMATLLFTTGSAAGEAVGPKLTPKLKGLLVEEMRAVLAAQQTILEAISQGNHAVVAEQAQKIHDSFILKQSLTPQDRKDLKAAVPPGFVETDQEFHRAAADLAAAAKRGESEPQLDHFDKMNRFCVTCHGRYAADRFPDL